MPGHGLTFAGPTRAIAELVLEQRAVPLHRYEDRLEARFPLPDGTITVEVTIDDRSSLLVLAREVACFTRPRPDQCRQVNRLNISFPGKFVIADDGEVVYVMEAPALLPPMDLDDLLDDFLGVVARCRPMLQSLEESPSATDEPPDLFAAWLETRERPRRRDSHAILEEAWLTARAAWEDTPPA